MLPLHLRPETRERRRDEASAWPDTVAMAYRSEAFAEDLPVLDEIVVPPPRPLHFDAAAG